MVRRYQETISVTLQHGQPSAFTWRGHRYPIVAILGTWRLATRWWQPEAAVERHYYRVQTPGFQVFELYQAQTGGWTLDVCQD
jgi:hypothetical protein